MNPNTATDANRPGGRTDDPPVVGEFTEYFASIIDERKQKNLLARVMAAAVQQMPDEAFGPVGRSAATLLKEAPETPDWLIPGVIARSWMVKLAAREKTGKGTLIAYLLGCLERGEATVFGPATAPTTALIYTEEPPDSIREKIDHAGLADAWIIYGWELSHLDWKAKVARLVKIATDGGHGVLFVDNISRAAGVEDEAGVELARRAEELGEAAKAAGLAVMLDHHHKKGASKLDDKSRGGTALAGACDNNIEMERLGGWESRVRKLSARGRISATIWEMTIALSDDGRRFEAVATATQPQTARERQRLKRLSDAGDAGMTASQFAEAVELGDTAARGALQEFVEKGWATETGTYPTRWCQRS